MLKNVAQNIGESEFPVITSSDAGADLFNGQQRPAPFLHDLSLLHDVPPAYYLKTDALASLISHVQSALSDHGPMQVIIAEHGRGKSALIRQLITEASNRWQLCYIHADYHLGVDHVIDALGQVFLARETVDFESLMNGLIRYGDNQSSPVVIVDDAQNISSYGLETLATIKRTVTEQGGNIDIILCASLVMRKNLASYGMSAFKDKWFEVHPLPRFTDEDTLTYLKESFKSGVEAEFTPSQLQMINRRGCGVPACINYHAELVLGRDVSDERLRLEHQQILLRQKKVSYFLGGSMAALLLLVTAIFMLSNSEQEPLVDNTVVMATLPVSTELATPAKQVVISAKVNVVEQQPLLKPEVKAPVVEQPTVKPAAKPMLTPVVTEALPKPLPVVVDQPGPPLAVGVKPALVGEPVPAVTKHEPARAVAATPAKVVKPSRDGAIPGVAWLKAQPENYFTIQLAGSPDEKNIIRYITRSSLEGELAYVLLERKSRSSWYVVLHGSFSSRAEAQRIIEFFPPELIKNRPWIRQFSELRNTLDER